MGYYEALAGGGPLTAPELAARTGTQARYAREWLEQQTVAGILAVENEGAPAEARRYFLPPGHDEVLAQPDSLNYLAPLAQMLAGAVRPLDRVLQAYRQGGGVPLEAYGADFREGQGRVNRVMFLAQLGSEWLPAIPDLHARLQADPPARVADLGCGAGWSSIGIALGYPKVVVDGFDSDLPVIVSEAQGGSGDGGSEGSVAFEPESRSETPRAADKVSSSVEGTPQGGRRSGLQPRQRRPGAAGLAVVRGPIKRTASTRIG